MSFYVRTLYYLKGCGQAIKKAETLVEKLNAKIDDEEVYITFNPSSNLGVPMIACLGCKTTFGNIYDALRDCGLSDINYIDYADCGYLDCEGCSDLARFIIVKEGDCLNDVIVLADSMSSAMYKLIEYLKDDKRFSEIINNRYDDMYDLCADVNEIAEEAYYRCLECKDHPVCDECDRDFENE